MSLFCLLWGVPTEKRILSLHISGERPLVYLSFGLLRVGSVSIDFRLGLIRLLTKIVPPRQSSQNVLY